MYNTLTLTGFVKAGETVRKKRTPHLLKGGRRGEEGAG